MGSLQQALPHPVDAETEAAILELLRRKVTGAVSLFVQTVRAAEELYGPEAPARIRQRMLERTLESAAARGVSAAERSPRAYCAAMDVSCRGSHEWVKLEDSETRQAYRYTRCLWAEAFRALDAADLGLWVCESDGPAVAAYDPRIRFQRSRTLMAGDDCCDHVYWCDDDAREG